MKKVVVYTKNNCMQCKMTKRFLSENGVEFEERNINLHPEYIDELKGRGFQVVPVVQFSEDDAIAGFRPDLLKKLAI
ncbi:glutaredoxin-like protein NrdH [Pediococcus acidilactici]